MIIVKITTIKYDSHDYGISSTNIIVNIIIFVITVISIIKLLVIRLSVRSNVMLA